MRSSASCRFFGTLGLLILCGLPERGVGQDEARGPKNVDGPLPNPRLYRRVHALCIGVNVYKHPGLVRALHTAEADATALANLFEKHYGYVVEPPMTGAKAEKKAILDKLAEYQRTLSGDDALIVYFGLHGRAVKQDSYGTAGYLVPYDAELDLDAPAPDPRIWADRAIAMKELGTLFKPEAFKCRHVLLLVDSCNSGYLGLDRRGPGLRPDLEQLVLRTSRMAITAGTETQSSLEQRDLGHSYFVHALLNKLNGPEPLSAMEVYVGLRTEVASLSQSQMLPQLRELVIDNGEFVFIPKSIKDEEVVSSIRQINRRIEARGARMTSIATLLELITTDNYHFSPKVAELDALWKQRVERFRENVAIGDPLAMAALLICCSIGLGTKPDTEEAHGWAVTAYNSGHPAGKYALALCYYHGLGDGVKKNEPAALELMQAAAVEKFLPAELLLAGLVIDKHLKHILPNEFDRSFIVDWVRSASVGTRPYVDLIIGEIYLWGVAGVPRNQARGLQLLKSAARNGVAQAQYRLALMYLSGIPEFMEKDFVRYLEWMRNAAEVGHELAHGHLAYTYYYLLKPRPLAV
jgi:TPR repeat protein/uncharacterized caspase-like protein